MCGMATVSFKDASRVYPGADHPAVDKLNLEIGDGEFMAAHWAVEDGQGKIRTHRLRVRV